MAPSFVYAIAVILSQLFPDIGIDAINTTLNTLVAIGAGTGILIRQIKTKRATLFGTRPEYFQTEV